MGATVKRSNKVSFGENLEISRGIISRKEYSEAEIQACWYTVDEQWALETELEYSLQKIEEGSRERGAHRGLEQFTFVLRVEQAWRRLSIVNSIMDELESQRHRGVQIYDWERFSRVSQGVSIESQAIALETAQFDEQTAQAIYSQPLNKVPHSAQQVVQKIETKKQPPVSVQHKKSKRRFPLFRSR